jgi:hypothetical protein
MVPALFRSTNRLTLVAGTLEHVSGEIESKVENAASCKVLDHAGFHPEGRGKVPGTIRYEYPRLRLARDREP